MLNPFYSGLVCLSSASGRFLNMSHSRRLCLARDYLAARFNERTSLAEAAAQADLSPFYFVSLAALCLLLLGAPAGLSGFWPATLDVLAGWGYMPQFLFMCAISAGHAFVQTLMLDP